jgi:hypothetical protein
MPNQEEQFEDLGDELSEKIGDAFREHGRDKGETADKEQAEDIPTDETVKGIQDDLDQLREQEDGGDPVEEALPEGLGDSEIQQAGETLQDDINLDMDVVDSEVDQPVEDTPIQETEIQSPAEVMKSDTQMQDVASVLELDVDVDRMESAQSPTPEPDPIDLDQAAETLEDEVDLSLPEEPEEEEVDLNQAAQTLESEVDLDTPQTRGSTGTPPSSAGAQQAGGTEVNHTITLIVSPSDDLVQQIVDKVTPVIAIMMADLQSQVEDTIGDAISLADRGGTIG